MSDPHKGFREKNTLGLFAESSLTDEMSYNNCLEKAFSIFVQSVFSIPCCKSHTLRQTKICNLI